MELLITPLQGSTTFSEEAEPDGLELRRPAPSLGPEGVCGDEWGRGFEGPEGSRVYGATRSNTP